MTKIMLDKPIKADAYRATDFIAFDIESQGVRVEINFRPEHASQLHSLWLAVSKARGEMKALLEHKHIEEPHTA